MSKKASFGFSFTAGNDDDDDDDSESVSSSSSNNKSSNSSSKSSSSIDMVLNRPLLSNSSKKKYTTDIKNIIQQLSLDLDNRNKNQEDFMISRESLSELSEIISDIQTYKCTIEALERKRDQGDICDPKCNSNIDFNKNITSTKRKLIIRILQYIDKMAEIFGDVADKYRARLCRIIAKVQKYGCKGLVSPTVMLSDTEFIKDLIQKLND